MHSYQKVLFPALRERRFVGGHRRRGHQVVHRSAVHDMKSRCWWHCVTCGGEWRC